MIKHVGNILQRRAGHLQPHSAHHRGLHHCYGLRSDADMFRTLLVKCCGRGDDTDGTLLDRASIGCRTMREETIQQKYNYAL